MDLCHNFDGILDNYCVPNVPLNGLWHQWPDKSDVQSENNSIQLDFEDREGKILIWQAETKDNPTIAMETS